MSKETIWVLTILVLLAGLTFGIKSFVWPFVSGLAGGAPDSKQHTLQSVTQKLPRQEYLYGIDLSHYQGEIQWNQIQEIAPEVPVSFVILRATMGENGYDRHFEDHWLQVKWKKKVRGAYHYFRPNEDGSLQAQQFISKVKLLPGDLRPIVDLEKEPRKKKIHDLRRELTICLRTLEAHYKVKPILYTMDSFYQSYLQTDEFKEYPLWIANYNLNQTPKTTHWIMWQFSEKGSLKGINEKVDLNLFRGGQKKLQQYLLP